MSRQVQWLGNRRDRNADHTQCFREVLFSPTVIFSDPLPLLRRATAVIFSLFPIVRTVAIVTAILLVPPQADSSFPRSLQSVWNTISLGSITSVLSAISAIMRHTSLGEGGLHHTALLAQDLVREARILANKCIVPCTRLLIDELTYASILAPSPPYVPVMHRSELVSLRQMSHSSQKVLCSENYIGLLRTTVGYIAISLRIHGLPQHMTLSYRRSLLSLR